MANKPPTRKTGRPQIDPPTPKQQARRKNLIVAWYKQHGQWCPGWQAPKHKVTPPNRLTADHIHPRRFGGENGPLQILCTLCNNRRKGNEWMDED